MKKAKLMLGDNIESLKKLSDNSIDSVVTDPPYALTSIKKRFGKEGSAPAQYGTDGVFQRASKGFMGKEWDAEVPTIEFWQEVYRVLKPGGHVLSFGGTRTYHRMVVNMEDAGFEIRDQIQWIYSTGFPKSLNIQKQLEKNEYIQCECSKQNTKHNLRPLPESNISQTINIENKQGEALLSQLSQQDLQISSNTTDYVWEGQSIVERWSNTIQEKGELQGYNIQESTRTPKTNGEERRIHNGAQDDYGTNDKSPFNQNGSSSSYRSQSKQQSPEQFGTMADERTTQKSRGGSVCDRCGKSIINLEGWGSSLKPANEPICLARKPLSEKSIAENVLKWGTGGLNIDGCRIEIVGKDDRSADRRTCNIFDEVKVSGGIDSPEYIPDENGRFPANIILDEGAAEMLDEQSGTSKSSPNKWQGDNNAAIYGKYEKGIRQSTFNDKGGASRFFFKASYNFLEQKEYKMKNECQQNNYKLVQYVEQNGLNISQITELIAQTNVEERLRDKLVLLVKSALNLSEKCTMYIVANIVAIATENMVSPLTQDFIAELENYILIQNLAQLVEVMDNTDTTPTTQSLMKLFGSALRVIEKNTQLDQEQEKEEKKSEQLTSTYRFRYQAKVSKAERNMGLDGFSIEILTPTIKLLLKTDYNNKNLLWEKEDLQTKDVDMDRLHQKDIEEYGVLLKKDKEWNIEWFGNILTDQFLMEAKSIIEMETNSTMIYQTLNLLIQKSIKKNIQESLGEMVSDINFVENVEKKNTKVSITLANKDGLNQNVSPVLLEEQWTINIKENKCNHPTLKPVALMTYLCRLITPPNGIVLDPFMGSGSTGISALLEGFRFVGMEMDPQYFKIAEARINSYEEYRKFKKT